VKPVPVLYHSTIHLEISIELGTHLFISRRSTRYLQSIRGLLLYPRLQGEPTKEELKQRKRGELGNRRSMKNTSRRKRGDLHLDSLRLRFCKRHLSKKAAL
jgi:hypothetical protein